jgi:hypothetical protein
VTSIETLLDLETITVDELIGWLKPLEERINRSSKKSIATLNLTKGWTGGARDIAPQGVGQWRLKTLKGVVIERQQSQARPRQGSWLGRSVETVVVATLANVVLRMLVTVVAHLAATS